MSSGRNNPHEPVADKQQQRHGSPANSFLKSLLPRVNLKESLLLQAVDCAHLACARDETTASRRASSLVLVVVLDLLLAAAVHHVFPHAVFRLARLAAAPSRPSSMQRVLLWLMGAPAGFKLNPALNRWLGIVFLTHLHLWQTVLEFLSSVLSWALQLLLGLSWHGGLAVQLCLAGDALVIAFGAVAMCEAFARKLYSAQLVVLSALWKLFRGMKRNVVRHRVDSCEFDLPSQLLGTVMFTCVCLLLPTTAVYHLYFASLRLYLRLLRSALFLLLFLVYVLPLRLLTSAPRPHLVCVHLVQMAGAASTAASTSDPAFFQRAHAPSLLSTLLHVSFPAASTLCAALNPLTLLPAILTASPIPSFPRLPL